MVLNVTALNMIDKPISGEKKKKTDNNTFRRKRPVNFINASLIVNLLS